VGDPTRTIQAHEFDGSVRWELPLGPGSDYMVGDGAIYTVAADGAITAYR
jgi:hypothetical protein